MSSKGLVRNESLRRGLSVLRVVVRAGRPITAADVARATQIPGPTVARLLATLADETMVVRDPGGGWRPGPGVVELAGPEGQVAAVVARAHEILRQLADDTGESTLLTRVRLPDSVEILVQIGADRLLGATQWVGRSFEARLSVAGWIAAAALDDDAIEAVGGSDPAERARWLAHVHDARDRGYAIDVDGLEAGLTSIAVAVPSSATGLTVGMAGPSLRLTEQRARTVVPQMLAAARALADDH